MSASIVCVCLALMFSLILFSEAQYGQTSTSYNQLQIELIKSIVLNNIKIQECSPVLISANITGSNTPELTSTVFSETAQLIIANILQYKKKSFDFTRHHSKSCSIVLYFLNGNESDIKFMNNFGDTFIRNLPGGIFETYHLILSTRNNFGNYISDLMVKSVPVPHILLQMHNLAFGHQINLNTIEILVPDSSLRHIKHLEYFPKKSNNHFLKNTFQERWKNFEGRPFILATTPDSSQKQMEAFIRTKKFSTYAIVGSYELLKFFNCTPVINAVKSGIFGRKTKDGKWIGMIGEVLDGRAHATTAIQHQPDRAEVLEFTKIYHFDNVAFISALPTKIGSHGNVEFLARPLAPAVWLSLLITFMTIYIVQFIKSIRSSTPVLWEVEALLIVNTMLRPTLDQPGDTPSLRRRLKADLPRFIFTLWLLGLIVLSCAYKSKIISVLLSPTFHNPPQTFAELADSNYGIGAVLYNESFLADGFSTMNTRIGHEVTSRVKTYKLTEHDCFTATQVRNDVCLSIRGFIEQVVYNYLTGESGQTLFRYSKDYVFPIFASMGVPRKFPHLKELLSTIISRVESQGLLQRWIIHARIASSSKGRKLAPRFRKHGDLVESISSGEGELKHYLAILGFGLGTSVGVFISEIILSFIKGKQNSTARVQFCRLMHSEH